MKKQVIAVIDEVKSILGDAYDVNTPSANVLSEDNIKTIKANILNGLINGDIAYKGDTADTKKLKVYASSLVKNHLNKCKALNGDIQYKASGDGPKRDERLRELNNLLKSGDYSAGTDEYTAIEEAIVTRKQELVAAKAKAKTQVKASEIDTSVLPIELQGLVDVPNGGE